VPNGAFLAIENAVTCDDATVEGGPWGAQRVPNEVDLGPNPPPNPIELSRASHSEWAVPWANRTCPETSCRFYTACSLGKPDMPRNLMPFLYRLFPGQTGHAPKPHAVFIPSVPWANRTCPL